MIYLILFYIFSILFAWKVTHLVYKTNFYTLNPGLKLFLVFCPIVNFFYAVIGLGYIEYPTKKSRKNLYRKFFNLEKRD